MNNLYLMLRPQQRMKYQNSFRTNGRFIKLRVLMVILIVLPLAMPTITAAAVDCTFPSCMTEFSSGITGGGGPILKV